MQSHTYLLKLPSLEVHWWKLSLYFYSHIEIWLSMNISYWAAVHIWKQIDTPFLLLHIVASDNKKVCCKLHVLMHVFTTEKYVCYSYKLHSWYIYSREIHMCNKLQTSQIFTIEKSMCAVSCTAVFFTTEKSMCAISFMTEKSMCAASWRSVQLEELNLTRQLTMR